MLNITDTALQINGRFFESLDALKKRKLLSGVSGFAKKYGVVLGNLYTIKRHKTGTVKAEYLHHLARDYGVSADWLLTGRGEMFTQSSSRSEESQTQETSPSDYCNRPLFF